jgi:uncharacterized protein YkwD
VGAAKHAVAAFVILSSLVFPPTSGAAGAAASSPSALLAAVNDARAAHGLPPLRTDSTLRRAARSHSVQMLRTGSFTHGPFAQRMQSFHAQGPRLAENIAWGTGSYGSAQAIVQAWLSSPEHRANLLRPGFTRIGLGVADGTFQGHPGAVVVTADFGGR